MKKILIEISKHFFFNNKFIQLIIVIENVEFSIKYYLI